MTRTPTCAQTVGLAHRLQSPPDPPKTRVLQTRPPGRGFTGTPVPTVSYLQNTIIRYVEGGRVPKNKYTQGTNWAKTFEPKRLQKPVCPNPTFRYISKIAMR